MKLKSEGKTEFERFNNVIGKLLSVSSKEMKKRIEADPRGKPKRQKRKSAKTSAASRDSGEDT